MPVSMAVNYSALQHQQLLQLQQQQAALMGGQMSGLLQSAQVVPQTSVTTKTVSNTGKLFTEFHFVVMDILIITCCQIF